VRRATRHRLERVGLTLEDWYKELIMTLKDVGIPSTVASANTQFRLSFASAYGKRIGTAKCRAGIRTATQSED